MNIRNTSFTDMFPQDESESQKNKRKPIIPIKIIAPKTTVFGKKNQYQDIPEKHYNKVIDAIDIAYENSPHARYLLNEAIKDECAIVLTTMGVSGYFHPQTNQLLMNYKYSLADLVNVVGHELGHHDFFLNGGKESFSSFCDNRTGLNALKISEADAVSSEGLVALQTRNNKHFSPWTAFKKDQPIVSEKMLEHINKNGIEDVLGLRDVAFKAWFSDKFNLLEAEKSRELYIFSSLIPFEQRQGYKTSWFQNSIPESAIIGVTNHHGVPYLSNADEFIQSRKFLSISKDLLQKIEKCNNIRSSLYGAEPDLSIYTLPVTRNRIIQPPTLVASTNKARNKLILPKKGTSR